MAKNEKTQKTGRIAATIAELKQVSWPAFPKVMRKLGSVLTITGMFLVIFMGMDALLKWMYNALIMGVVGTWNVGGFFTRPPVDEASQAITMSVGEMIAAAIVAVALVTAAIVAIIIYKSKKKEDF